MATELSAGVTSTCRWQVTEIPVLQAVEFAEDNPERLQIMSIDVIKKDLFSGFLSPVALGPGADSSMAFTFEAGMMKLMPVSMSSQAAYVSAYEGEAPPLACLIYPATVASEIGNRRSLPGSAYFFDREDSPASAKVAAALDYRY